MEMYINTVDFYSAIQMKFVGKQMHLGSNILNEETQTQKYNQTKPQTSKLLHSPLCLDPSSVVFICIWTGGNVDKT